MFLIDISCTYKYAFQYIRISDDTDFTVACWYHNSGMWDEDRYPEISISFIGGCLKDSISEELDKTLRVGITNVRMQLILNRSF